MRAALAGLVLAVALAACDGAGPLTAEAPSPSPTPEADAGPDQPRQIPTEADEPGAQGRACDPADVAEMDEVVGGQLAAFADGDFAAALGFATPGFRDDWDPEAFERLITEDYPQVSAAVGHSVDTCHTDGAVATLSVRVVDPDGAIFELTYLLEQVDGDWRIAGATPPRPVGGAV